MIGSIGLYSQSAVTLYIYRVGKTYPARNSVYRSKSIKNFNCTWTPPRPVGPTGQTSWSCHRRLDRSDCLDIPARPVCSGCCQFWSSTISQLPHQRSHYISLFLAILHSGPMVGYSELLLGSHVDQIVRFQNTSTKVLTPFLLIA